MNNIKQKLHDILLKYLHVCNLTHKYITEIEQLASLIDHDAEFNFGAVKKINGKISVSFTEPNQMFAFGMAESNIHAPIETPEPKEEIKEEIKEPKEEMEEKNKIEAPAVEEKIEEPIIEEKAEEKIEEAPKVLPHAPKPMKLELKPMPPKMSGKE